MLKETSIGAIEFNSIAQGILATDFMLKAASVENFLSKTLCPGKFITIISGLVSDVEASIEAGKRVGGRFIVDEFIIRRVHEEVFPALFGIGEIEEIEAVGVIETYSVSSAILSADKVLKTASVKLIEIKMASGIGGKGVVIFTGSVSDVESSIKAGVDKAVYLGEYVSHIIIPRPHGELIKSLL